VGNVLQLLGAGATGAILMALGPRPLRTKALTERADRHAPRTVYRYASRLANLGLLDRQEEDGVPSTVTYNLSDQGGRDLFYLLDAYASAALPRGPTGRIEEGSWTVLSLLGELWESGWAETLSREARSPTELAEGTPGMTFHQANRRAHLLSSRGLLRRCDGRARGVRYELASPARQGMGLVAGIGRWRQRHGLADGKGGLSAEEMKTILRATAPLVEIPGRRGENVRLEITKGRPESDGNFPGPLVTAVDEDGRLRCLEDGGAADAWATGTINTWLSALLDGNRGRMRVGGDLSLIDACLVNLHRALWGEASALPA
jgi:DNA-binding HxlR family transcriptional regulator